MARKRNTKPDEHSADPAEAAKAADTKKATKPAARVDQKLVNRAVALRKKNIGLVKLTRQLTDEGFKSPSGKELRPQTVRAWLLKALKVDHLERIEPTGGASFAGAVAETAPSKDEKQKSEKK